MWIVFSPLQRAIFCVMTWFNSWNPMNSSVYALFEAVVFLFYYRTSIQPYHILIGKLPFSSVTATFIEHENLYTLWTRREIIIIIKIDEKEMEGWMCVCVCIYSKYDAFKWQSSSDPRDRARMVASIFNTSFSHSLRYYFFLIRFFFAYYTLQVFLLYIYFRLHRAHWYDIYFMRRCLTHNAIHNNAFAYQNVIQQTMLWIAAYFFVQFFFTILVHTAALSKSAILFLSFFLSLLFCVVVFNRGPFDKCTFVVIARFSWTFYICFEVYVCLYR